MTSLLGIDLRGRDVLVVGGGRVAARRARAWSDAGARVHVVSPWTVPEMRELLEVSGRWTDRDAREEDLDGAWLVLAATDDSEVNRMIARSAERRRVWCIVADDASAGTARTPALARSGDLVVGVVSDGSSDPRRVAAVRDVLADRLRSGVDQRRRRSGPGRVTLVGGGPGAVDLLTVRGRRALAEADVVVDRLGPVAVIDELPPDVEVIDVGKEPGRHAVPQEEINALLVEHARAGRSVVRLKGGDPFVFGRGGEEVRACRAAGIDVEVVPGLSSAWSGPALAGIPLTHRGVVGAVHVVAGHDGLEPSTLTCLRERTATVVVLMGVAALGRIAGQALTAGADPGLPVAVVERASMVDQRVTRAPLQDIAARAAAAGVTSPALIVLGDAVATLEESRAAGRPELVAESEAAG
ncbi:uroporphyrinogen-III C-methyltransferase [Georgenia sp. Z1491]|uniref:uroporphyrinogen-III C-methyltransferase n=1 Tax=Georgenia sp. Z1491 TaxID=3416707 RepID=UPI003CF5F1A7